MKTTFNKEKGITLVSVVVTIIVLIILAGVSINLILGNNGIITVAKRAKENIELAQIEEQTKLNELYTQLEAEGEATGGNSYDAIAKLIEFKKVIAEAITNKGVETKETDSAETMANNIANIETIMNTEGTATDSDILEGKTAWINGIQLTGKMKDNGAQTASLNAGESYTIPEGYHDGLGEIKANSLADQTSATATAGDITSGKTAWVNGVLVEGTKSTSATQESKSSSYGIGGYGSTTVTLTYSKNVLGVVSYSITDSNNYAKLTSISISGNKITLGMQTYHGHGASGTLTVKAALAY